MLKNILDLSRFNKKLIMLLIDSITVVIVLLLSFSTRMGYWYIPEQDVMFLIISSPFLALPIFTYFGLYKAVIRYINFIVLLDVLKAVLLYSLIWGMFGFLTAPQEIPRSIIFINCAFSILSIGGLRVFAYFLFKNSFSQGNNQKNSLIYGAGEAGIQLVSVLEHSSSSFPIGFIDDSKELQGRKIKGLNVYSVDEIANMIHDVDEILIAMPSISKLKKLSIINKIDLYPLKVKVLPGMEELVNGKVELSDLREISINDLLWRDIVEPNKNLLSKNITNKTVLVSGAGGSIGSELCRRIILLNPKVLILYEISELALYNIQKELSSVNTLPKNIYPILGSVNDKNRMTRVFQKFNVDTVYHAAAYKHVPMVELNTTEGVNNNIFGTLNCALVAMEQSVETFVLISSDKAVRPSNTMGATKRIAELILQSLSAKQEITKFTIVRFGNVLGSSGSVIPLFKQQIKDGGPLTVTDQKVVRYFMTIKEAVELVIQSGAMGLGGDVFVLNMGNPVKIDDLARKMVRLSGLQIKDSSNPGGDIEIKYTGLRPGEKLFEELLIGDNVSDTENPLIMRAKEDMLTWDELKLILEDLKLSSKDFNYKEIRSILIRVVPGFKPQSPIVDILHKN